MELRAVDVARRLGGRLEGPIDPAGDLVVDGLAIDSRVVRPGQLFAALRAERDGHDFVPAAFDAGAAAVLVDRPGAPVGGWGGPAIVVASVPDSLAELARMAREHVGHPNRPGRPVDPDRVVGITGSVGKTTTKDLLANVAGTTFATVASERSFNNELGVPLTLANAPDGTEVAIVEMGARGAGHIRTLCEMARPTVGVVTVVEGVHTEVMGTIDQIALAKRELVEQLPPAGVAVLNVADPNVAAMAAHTVASVLTFGGGVGGPDRWGEGGATGEVLADDVTVTDDLQARFTLRSPWGSVAVHLGVRGVHNVTNALAAAAAGLWLGVPVDQVAAGLELAPASPWRMELVRVPGGPALINDAYNAGPASMTAAVRALAALAVPEGGRRIAVLGVMAELGPEGPGEHRRVAALANELGIEVLAVGTDLYAVGDRVPSADEVVEALGELGPADAVLIKGSRVAGLERAAAALTRPGR